MQLIENVIKNGKVLVYYQPVLDNNTNLLHKYEALIRINHNNIIYEPADFLNHSRQNKQYNELCKKMLLIVFADLHRYKTLKTAINITMHNMVDIGFCSLFFSLLSKTSNIKRITIELVESDEIDFERVSNFLSRLKKMGISISLDDFGSGYSNFDYLLNLDLDYIKIYGGIIKNIHLDKHRTIIESMLNYSKKFNIPVVAEHVENHDIFKTVKEMGIQFSQGYYIGRPVPNLMTSLNRTVVCAY